MKGKRIITLLSFVFMLALALSIPSTLVAGEKDKPDEHRDNGCKKDKPDEHRDNGCKKEPLGELVFKTLYDFTGGEDGAYPFDGFVQDKEGNLYGITAFGGTSNVGTVFKLDSKGNHTVLYSFTGGADGEGPNGGLIRDKAGNLYGTTLNGGYDSYVFFWPYWRAFSLGTVFKVDSNGNYTVLYRFTGLEDGDNPRAGLIQDKEGNLYGTTSGEAPDG
jgi:uncharacterized repeat protein (TIGR03803 family)